MSVFTEDIRLSLREPLYNLIKSFSNCVTQQRFDRSPVRVTIL